MMMLMALVIGLVSGLVPVVNMESFLVGAALIGHPALVPVAVAAAAGQTTGKTLIFLAARKAMALPVPGTGRFARPLARCTERLDRLVPRRGGASAIVLVSAATGLPPLLVTSATVARTAMSTAVFTALCLVGRATRFAAVLAVPGLLG